MGEHVEIIRKLALKNLLFRERDVREAGASPSCLDDARTFGFVVAHGHGVWSHPDYEPTRYELVQIRMRKAVFWGPSALWLLGAEKKEPEALWIALGNNYPLPSTLEYGSVVIRTRSLEKDVQVIEPRLLELRVHSIERARADVARNDCVGLVARALRPTRFDLEPHAALLSARLQYRGCWSPPCPAPEGYEDREPERWTIVSSFAPRPRDPIRARFGRRH